AVLTYKDDPNEMEITMANGSPFTWLERKQGQANFLVWAGGPTDQGGAPTVWQNENGVLGLTIDSSFNPDNAIPQTVSKAAYVVIADQGTWVRTDATRGMQSMFTNCTASDPIQLLFPHHFKSLHPGQRPLVDGRYTWNSIMGPLRLYKAGAFVQLIDTDGFLPFFPDQVVDSNLQNPLQARQSAVED